MHALVERKATIRMHATNLQLLPYAWMTLYQNFNGETYIVNYTTIYN